MTENNSQNIDSSLVRTMRERTGYGLMECKKALIKTNGNMNEAIKALTEEKKEKISRGVLSEDGVRILNPELKEGVVITSLLNDLLFYCVFKCKSEQALLTGEIIKSIKAFEPLLNLTPELIVDADSPKVKERAFDDGWKNFDFFGTLDASRKPVDDFKLLVSKYGEAFEFPVFACLRLSPTQRVFMYNHNTQRFLHIDDSKTVGSNATLIVLDVENSEGNDQKFKDGEARKALDILGKYLATLLAFGNPLSYSSKTLDQNLIEEQKLQFKAEAEAAGKKPEQTQKIIEGKLNKFFKENTVLGADTYRAVEIGNSIKIADGEAKPISELIAMFEKEFKCRISSPFMRILNLKSGPQ